MYAKKKKTKKQNTSQFVVGRQQILMPKSNKNIKTKGTFVLVRNIYHEIGMRSRRKCNNCVLEFIIYVEIKCMTTKNECD